jgi:hypothetical protein
MPKAKRKTTRARELKRVKIGYAPVRVLRADGLADSGHYAAERQVVGVDTSSLPADQLNTLFHELTHVIAQRFHLDLATEVEEHLAQVFGNAWAEILIYNPELLPFVEQIAREARAVSE